MTLYTLRHSAATYLIMNGVDLRTVADVPPQLEMDIPAVCIKGLEGCVFSPLGLIGS